MSWYSCKVCYIIMNRLLPCMDNTCGLFKFLKSAIRMEKTCVPKISSTTKCVRNNLLADGVSKTNL